MSQPHISLNTYLLKEMLALRFGGKVEELVEEWHTREADGFSSSSGVPHRATVYRWLKGQFPRRDEYLRLCGLLDVDPFSLLKLPEGREAAVIHRLTLAFWLDRWEPNALSFMRAFFGHQSVWPPTIATGYYGHGWHQDEFRYTPGKRSNYYAQIEIHRVTSADGAFPQVWHFAYQQPEVFREAWIPYGFVERCGRSVRLISINGQFERYEADLGDAYTLVETWFGPSPVLFGIASLHPFSMTVRDREVETVKQVRFNA